MHDADIPKEVPVGNPRAERLEKILLEFINDLEVGGPDLKGDWPDLWLTYLQACKELGREPVEWCLECEQPLGEGEVDECVDCLQEFIVCKTCNTILTPKNTIGDLLSGSYGCMVCLVKHAKKEKDK